MKHSRNSQQIQGDFQDFEAPAPAEPEYAGEVTMALPPVPMPDPNARRGLAQPAAKRSVLWSVLGILGEVLMTLAAVCALYVVWQMWWTGVQSEHTQVETRQSASWSDPAGGDSSKVAKAQSGDVPVQPTSTSDGELIAQVYVPRFGQGWVRNVVEGTDEAELSLHGLGHYPSTQMPGSVGNFAVAGHRNGYGRPLGDVDLLQEGDAIIVRTKDYWYVYKYTTYKIVTPEHSEVIAANPEDLNTPPSKRMITLTTCEPKYTTATHRWISYGELSYAPIAFVASLSFVVSLSDRYYNTPYRLKCQHFFEFFSKKLYKSKATRYFTTIYSFDFLSLEVLSLEFFSLIIFSRSSLLKIYFLLQK